MRTIHWLFDYQNPYILYNAAAVTLWIFIFANWGFTFGPAEYAGAKGWHGMCYATDVLRCLPRAFWIVAGTLAFIHFDFHRKVIAAVQTVQAFSITSRLQEIFAAALVTVFLYPIVLWLVKAVKAKFA